MKLLSSEELFFFMTRKKVGGMYVALLSRFAASAIDNLKAFHLLRMHHASILSASANMIFFAFYLLT